MTAIGPFEKATATVNLFGHHALAEIAATSPGSGLGLSPGEAIVPNER